MEGTDAGDLQQGINLVKTSDQSSPVFLFVKTLPRMYWLKFARQITHYVAVFPHRRISKVSIFQIADAGFKFLRGGERPRSISASDMNDFGSAFPLADAQFYEFSDSRLKEPTLRIYSSLSKRAAVMLAFRFQ
jgi:hypothetical protein